MTEDVGGLDRNGSQKFDGADHNGRGDGGHRAKDVHKSTRKLLDHVGHRTSAYAWRMLFFVTMITRVCGHGALLINPDHGGVPDGEVCGQVPNGVTALPASW